MKKATLKKPVPDTEQALQFATGSAKAEGRRRGRKPQKAAEPRSGQVPPEDVRLTANIRKELHLKLKIAAANRSTTIGELIEELVAKHL